MNIFHTKLLFLIFMVMATNFSVAQQKTVFCFGNSLTAGYGLPKEKSWPMLIQDKLENSGYDYKVIQSGLSGETSAGGLSRIKWVLREPADIFILELGPNDGLRGLPTEQTVMNLQKIIGINQKEEGQKIVAETVWKYLKPAL